MISKKPPTFKPQNHREDPEEELAVDRLAGAGEACSPRETSSCDGSWFFPGLCQLGHDKRPPQHLQSMSQTRQQLSSCMSSTPEIIIPDHDHHHHHQHQQNDDDINGNPLEDHRANVFGNGYPPPAGIYEEEGCGAPGAGGINDGEEGTSTGAGTGTGRKKRTWTAEEDEKLKRAVEEHGSGNWMIIERCSGLGRTSKSCRLRWTNHLRPNLKKGSFSEAEERTVVMLHQKYGNKWSFIASKLPGRTDNEVKNFWHGRLRRCRKQYLDIYPTTIQGDHEQQQVIHHGSAATCTDYNNNNNMSNHFPVSSTSSSYVNQKPSTDQNQNHLLLSPPPPLHHHHQMQHGLPIINAAAHQSQLHSNIILQAAALSTDPSPPPAFSKFSSPEQGSISPGSSSSVSTSRLLASQVSAHFNSITRGSPTETVGQQQQQQQQQQNYLSARQTTDTNTISHVSLLPLPSSISCQVNIPTSASSHSPLELKVPYDSYFRVNQTSMTSSSPPLCISPKLEIPATSPALESQTEMWLNSTVELTKPFSTDFELPQSQSSPSSYFNRASSISNFTPNPELLSFQSPENGSLQLQVQEVTVNLHKMGTAENGGVQQDDAHAKTDLLYSSPLSEKDNPDNRIPSAAGTDASVFLNPNKRKENFDCEGGRETINSSSGSQVTKKNLQRNRLVVDKRLKTELLRGKISRREGLLSEISKTGVLLVEKAKKERLISKLLSQSSKQDNILTQSPNTENLQLGEISKIKAFLGDSLSIEDILTDMCSLRDEKSEEDAFLAVNSTLLEHQNLQENLLDKSSSESVLTSYEQDQMHDLDVLGTQIYGTDLLKPVGGICNELNSVQVPLDQVFDEIYGRDVQPGLGLQGQEEHELDHSMNQLESGNVGSNLSNVGLYETDCLNKMTLRREYSENSRKEFAEQDNVGCSQWGGQDDQDLILDDSNWGIHDGRYIFGNMMPNSAARLDTLDSSCPITSSSAGLAMEDGQRNEMIPVNRNGAEESSRKRYLGESSIERVHGLQELTLSDFLPVTNQSTTYHMLSSDAQCSSRITIEEDGQTEELSSLLEFLPTILPEWNNFSHNTSTSK